MTLRYPTGAGSNPEATSNRPPRWAESLLIHMLKPRDRESIPGDLFEEYREDRVPALGRARANLWYCRQVLSLASYHGGPMKRSLMCLCFFTLATSVCLGLTETLQRPPLFEVRIGWAVLLGVASLSTVFYLVFPEYRLLRILVSFGAFLMLSPTIGAIAMTLGGEGHALLIGAVVILQLVLSVLTLLLVSDVPGSRLHL